MGELKASNTEALKANDKVEIFVPRGAVHDDPNVFISVNGVNYLLPKGKKSLVPRAVAKEFFRSQRAHDVFNQTVDMLLEMSNIQAIGK